MKTSIITLIQQHTRSETFTAVKIWIEFFWVVTPYNLVYDYYLQAYTVSHSRRPRFTLYNNNCSNVIIASLNHTAIPRTMSPCTTYFRFYADEKLIPRPVQHCRYFAFTFFNKQNMYLKTFIFLFIKPGVPFIFIAFL